MQCPSRWRLGSFNLCHHNQFFGSVDFWARGRLPTGVDRTSWSNEVRLSWRTANNKRKWSVELRIGELGLSRVAPAFDAQTTGVSVPRCGQTARALPCNRVAPLAMMKRIATTWHQNVRPNDQLGIVSPPSLVANGSVLTDIGDFQDSPESPVSGTSCHLNCGVPAAGGELGHYGKDLGSI